MKPHPRIRRAIKWGGAAATVVLVGVWVLSFWRNFVWVSRAGDGMGLGAGGVFVARSHTPVAPPDVGWHAMAREADVGFWFFYEPFGAGGWSLFVPLWVPIAAVAAVTADAWYMDKRRRRGDFAHLCAKCGYDRTGLAAAAPCPECGTEPNRA
jgi:hypothetical protein